MNINKYHRGYVGFDSTTCMNMYQVKPLEHSEDDTISSYYITIILMHVDTQDKSLSTPSYLSMA